MTRRAAAVHFILYSHATFSGSAILRDEDGNPVDLTGCTAVMHVRRDIDDDAPLISMSTSDGDIELGGADGTIEFDAGLPSDLDFDIDSDGEYFVHDILVTYPDGTTEREWQGSITAQKTVTRP